MVMSIKGNMAFCWYKRLALAGALIALTACAPAPIKMSDQHIAVDKDSVAGDIPEPVMSHSSTGREAPAEPQSEEVYTVVVNDVDLRGLLFALSRDATLDIDIASDIEGSITLNAIDQTLAQILNRIVDLTDIRYRIRNGVLVIEKDSPFFVHYKVDYLNMNRSSQSLVSISTQVATTGVGANTENGGGGANNNSSTHIENGSNHHFWQTLTQNIRAIVYGGDSVESTLRGENNDDTAEAGEADEESAAELADTSIIVNAESGILTVKTTQKKHNEIQRFLDEVLDGATRQVLIEATIVEVKLNDTYQAGVDWSRLIDAGTSGLSFNQTLIGENLAKPPVSTLTYTDAGSHDISATIKMLSEFGNTKVLSTPKLMVLNNQTALLKVVDNLIYFTIDVEEDVQEGFINRTFTSDIHSVPVGLVMSVTPQISDVEQVTLNVRPTISRVLRFVEDPNPALIGTTVKSLIPEISVREMESVMQIAGGDIAIIGGLMQDQQTDATSGVPGLSKLPWVGDLFSYKDNDYSKAELIIFIRPTIIERASLQSRELASYKTLLPDALGSAKRNEPATNTSE